MLAAPGPHTRGQIARSASLPWAINSSNALKHLETGGPTRILSRSTRGEWARGPDPTSGPVTRSAPSGAGPIPAGRAGPAPRGVDGCASRAAGHGPGQVTPATRSEAGLWLWLSQARTGTRSDEASSSTDESSDRAQTRTKGPALTALRGGIYTMLYYTIQYYTILHYTRLYYTILYYTILHYTIIYYYIT